MNPPPTLAVTVPVPHWVERGQFTPGNSVPRFHIVWGTGRELALRLIDRLQKHPRRKHLEIRFGQRVDFRTFAVRRPPPDVPTTITKFGPTSQHGRKTTLGS